MHRLQCDLEHVYVFFCFVSIQVVFNNTSLVFLFLARELKNLLVTLLAALLGEKDSVDVGEHTTLSDGHTGKEFG